jgi:hypothetical protein
VRLLGFFARPSSKQHITRGWEPTRIFDLDQPHLPDRSSSSAPTAARPRVAAKAAAFDGAEYASAHPLLGGVEHRVAGDCGQDRHAGDMPIAAVTCNQ